MIFHHNEFLTYVKGDERMTVQIDKIKNLMVTKPVPTDIVICWVWFGGWAIT